MAASGLQKSTVGYRLGSSDPGYGFQAGIEVGTVTPTQSRANVRRIAEIRVTELDSTARERHGSSLSRCHLHSLSRGSFACCKSEIEFRDPGRNVKSGATSQPRERSLLNTAETFVFNGCNRGAYVKRKARRNGPVPSRALMGRVSITRAPSNIWGEKRTSGGTLLSEVGRRHPHRRNTAHDNAPGESVQES